MLAFTIQDRAPWPLGIFDSLAALPGIAHAVTTRDGPAFGEHGDDPQSAAGAAEVARALAVPGVAWTRQAHGGVVLAVDIPGYAGEADALVTATPGLAVLGRSADCPLILTAGRRTGGGWAVGFAHASWRSTVAGITIAMVARLEKMGASPAGLVAAIAPSAGPCCYEVGNDVRDAAIRGLGATAANYFAPHRDRWRFDLWSANLAQLVATGVPAGNVALSRICTICQGERFWSWRAQGEAAGRFAAAIAASC